MLRTVFQLTILFFASGLSHAGLPCPPNYQDIGASFCLLWGETEVRTGPLNFHESEQKCAVLSGGTLATFTDASEAQDFSSGIAMTAPAVTMAIRVGYYNSQSHSPTNPGVWHDLSGSTCSPMQWPVGQPDNIRGVEGCMQMEITAGVPTYKQMRSGVPSYRLNDVPCSTRNSSILCIWRPSPLVGCPPIVPTTLKPSRKPHVKPSSRAVAAVTVKPLGPILNSNSNMEAVAIVVTIAITLILSYRLLQFVKKRKLESSQFPKKNVAVKI